MTASAGRFVSMLTSPLAGVPDVAWTRFVSALELQPIGWVSQSGGLGSYDMRPRRLVELGYGCNLRTERAPGGRQIYACDFVLPLTRARFLADPLVQYAVLSRSTMMYHRALAEGLERPSGVSMAGALAILHRGGRGALRGWPNLFSHTQHLYEAARGAF